MDESGRVSREAGKIFPTDPLERLDDFSMQVIRFGLTTEDFDNGILVVGSGDMSFAYEAQQLGVPPGRIVGIELNPEDYSLAGSHPYDEDRVPGDKKRFMSLYRGDVRDMTGVPDGSFKLVLSHQAPPAVYYSWLNKGKEYGKEHDGVHSQRYMAEASAEKAPDAIYQSMREMMRVAAPDGEVRMWPMHYASEMKKDNAYRLFNKHLNDALKKLHEEFNFVVRKLPTVDRDSGLFCLCLKKRVSGKNPGRA